MLGPTEVKFLLFRTNKYVLFPIFIFHSKKLLYFLRRKTHLQCLQGTKSAARLRTVVPNSFTWTVGVGSRLCWTCAMKEHDSTPTWDLSLEKGAEQEVPSTRRGQGGSTAAAASLCIRQQVLSKLEVSKGSNSSLKQGHYELGSDPGN